MKYVFYIVATIFSPIILVVMFIAGLFGVEFNINIGEPTPKPKVKGKR